MGTHYIANGGPESPAVPQNFTIWFSAPYRRSEREGWPYILVERAREAVGGD